MNNNQKCGFISIIGAPNAGKSTLMNKIIGSKVSIVTPKVQTTRTRITGITVKGDAQLVFIDTPGIFLPKKRLDKAMVKAAWQGDSGVDYTILLVDAKRGICKNTMLVAEGLKNSPTKKILVLNKIDLVAKQGLLELSEALHKEIDFEKSFMISAKAGKGVEDIVEYLANNSSDGHWMYPEDQVSDISSRLLASEVTREKLMLMMNNEIPYKLTVDTESYDESKREIKINQVIYVTSENYKKMIVGKQGATIKKIGEMARKELSWMMEKKVHLFLFVKVKENWLDSKEHYQQMGLEFR